MDHEQAPVLDALADYDRRDRYGFTPPGHKHGRGVDEATLRVLGPDVFRSDVLAIAGLDDRGSTGQVLSRAQELMADAVGAQHAFFSTCGSSLSVKAAMLAVAGGQEDGLLVGRDAHKSVIAGLVLSGMRPIWVRPRWDEQRHLAHPPAPADVAAALDASPGAAGLLITSPTPYGTCADLAAIVQVCHERDKPVIVDEAWGAHLPFHKDLPTWAMDAGADICVVSVHKMGAGLEQGSVFHLQGKLIDIDRLQACSDLLSTTSPNVLLYAAIDGWRRHMMRAGRRLLDDALGLVDRVRSRIDQMPGLEVMERQLLGQQASHDLDRLQVVIDLEALGISGYTAADWLRAERALDVGLSDHRRIAAQFSFADNDETAERLIRGLADLVAMAPGLPRAPQVRIPPPRSFELERVMLPRDTFFGAVRSVPAPAAVGCIAAEQITPYPPGIPVVLPGERITRDVLDYLSDGVSAGMVIPDAADPELKNIRVNMSR